MGKSKEGVSNSAWKVKKDFLKEVAAHFRHRTWCKQRHKDITMSTGSYKRSDVGKIARQGCPQKAEDGGLSGMFGATDRIVFLQNSYSETLTPQATGFGDNGHYGSNED